MNTYDLNLVINIDIKNGIHAIHQPPPYLGLKPAKKPSAKKTIAIGIL